jgi:RNA-directed DNA polymerase
MADLVVRQHPDKTVIGRIARGFDFLGYRFTADGLAVARQTVELCHHRISGLMSRVRMHAASGSPFRAGYGGPGQGLGMS